MLERNFQPKFIEAVEERIPGCVIMKNDANYRQGFPDLTIYYKNKFALIETKQDKDAKFRPNQELYLNEFGEYTFTARVQPENKEEVLNGLAEFFGV